MKLCPFAVHLLLLALFLSFVSTSAFGETHSGTLTAAGQVDEYIVTLPATQTGVRLVLSSSSNTNFSFYTGTTGVTTAVTSASNTNMLHTLLVPASDTDLVDGASYHVRITGSSNATYPISYSFTDDLTYARDLTWDDGLTPGGTSVMPQPDAAGGDYLFRMHTGTSAYGAWRTILKSITGGEAAFYMRLAPTPPTTSSNSYKSERVGDDGLVLAAGQFSSGQDWYILVHANPGAGWQLVSGDIYAQDLGTVTDTAANPSATIGPEGTYYFRTTIDAATQGWRLWANTGGSTAALPLLVRKGSAPVSAYNQSIQQSEEGQMLLVPPYLTASDSYLVGIPGVPGTTFNFDSRKQQIIDLAFEGAASLTVPGYGYITYRVEVPVQQIAWQVNLSRQTPAGNPELYVRQGNIPNRWNNDALSEAPAGVGDSVTLVPPGLTNGTWYITVYGTGSFDYSLVSKKPEITDISYIGSVTNADNNRSGWRYYKVGDIASQLGTLGWQIELDQAHRSGRQIAIRQNAVPATWSYRSNDNQNILSTSHLDKQSAVGILQDPNHVADIWYVGVYAPNISLDAFTLTTLEIPAPLFTLASSTTTVTNQSAELWQWHKVIVPADAALKGWDLRLKVTAGTPQMVVRRDSLPSIFTSPNSCGPYPVYVCSSWATGSQWSTTPGQDWTGRAYITYNTVKEKDSYLIMGMGSPLETGTYYVGVSRAATSSDNTPMSYTLESRGIGIGGGYPIQVQELAYAGGTTSSSDLAPREVGWYHVSVPAGATSWSLNLIPTVGEALLAVRHGRLPNSTATSIASDSPTYFNGTTRQKPGNEYFYKYAPKGQTLITSGDYYVAVISEGQNPADANAIGSGPVSYTLTSVGEMPIDSRVASPVATGVITSWTGQSAAYGSQKVYRFRVPAGLTSIEVRLKNKSGNPVFSIRQDGNNSGRIPYPEIPNSYSQEDGNDYAWRNSVTNPASNVVTISSPAAGDYTLTLAADRLLVNSSYTYPDAGYDLEVEGMDTVNLPFANGIGGAIGQAVQTWSYYKVTVPVDATLKGWDLRLKVTAGTPQMVVRRDSLPNTFTTNTGNCGGPYPVYSCSSWATGFQWSTTPGQDWTGRLYTSNSTVKDKDSYLIMGMGSPLEAGTYYIGVTRATGSTDTTPMTYDLVSRGIGIGGGYPIQVQDLAYAGGTASASDLAPREVGWYRVNVPVGASSWSLNLTPTQGEALLAVRHGRLPNITAANSESDSPTYFNGTTRQKSGNEYFYKYAPNTPATQTTITSGDYYVAVISEGQNPATNSTIGSGTVNYTLTSVGEMPIDSRVVSPIATGVITSWTSQSIPYGAQKVYRFRVPAGLTSIEVRLKNKTGNPVFGIRQDGNDIGKITSPPIPSSYSQEGGSNYAWRNNATIPAGTIVTIASPVAGDYTLTLAADSLVVNNAQTYPAAVYELEVEGMGTTDLPFTNGSAGAISQDYETWRFYKVIVPAAAALKGWDLRLKVTAGAPQMVVRRDSLPDTFTTTAGSCGGSSPIYLCSNWATASQWGTTPGLDWTGRAYITYNSVKDKDSYLIMGMGSPLEAGTYYVGVSRATNSSDNTPMSYTLESRGIGDSGSSFPIQVQELAYAGGLLPGSIPAPRGVGWYRVSVPVGATSWSLNLTPTLGEAMLAVRHGRLPNTAASNVASDSPTYFNGTTRQKSGNEYFYKYAPNTGTVITAGDYYVAVISEGQNPANVNAIGSDSAPVNFTLTSVGEMPIDSKIVSPIAAGVITNWTGQSAPYGSQKVYRFRVPAGLASIEVRLKNKTGNPVFSIRQDSNNSGKIPYPQIPNTYPQEGGSDYVWRNNATSPVSNVVTIASPVAGDYTLTLAADSLAATYPDAGYDLEVSVVPATPLALTGGSAFGSLIDQQVAYYQVTVPETFNGFPVAGWKIVTAATLGSATLRVAKGEVPGAVTPSLSSSQQNTVIAPPYLSPGIWYIEVKGTGQTSYTITSDIISADPAKHRRSWSMPGKNGSFTRAGLTSPYFGDSGVDDLGNSIINQATGDQGTDLGQNDWHFYRITVPAGNGALLRTVVEAISGTPELYIREANGVPSPYHRNHATNPNDSQSPWAYDRLQTLTTGTLYGNWVPLVGKTETELAAGEWWIGIKAVTTNVRYRLKVAAGNVRDMTGPVDSSAFVQDMNQSGGNYTGQTLAAGDMRYYRVTVPQSSTTLAGSTPLSWNLTLAQQIGDVVVFVRDTIPPGQGATGNAGASVSFSAAASIYFQDWYDDNSSISPNPYTVIDAPGTTALTLPPVEPGKTYYLGVYARSSATFDLASAIGGSNLALTAILPFTNGTDSRSLAAGEQVLYRIDVPADGILWHHNATNAAGIQLYLEQDTVPTENSIYNHWRNNGTANATLNQNLNVFPWQPGHSYYLLARNTTAGALPFSISINGHTSLVGLDITVSGNGSGNITSSPNLISCAGGICSAQIFPYTSITLSRSQTPGTTFTGWGGDCSGTGSCVLTMNVPHSVTATFTLNSYTVTTSRIGAGSGSIASTPPGIDCRTGGACSAPYLYGTSVTLTATPDPGNAFTGWSGACSGTGSCTFTVDGAKSAIATFVPFRQLSIVFSGSGGGTVTSTSDAGISCSSAKPIGCTHDYPNGTVVNLNIVPDWKSVFSSWTNATPVNSPNSSVTMNSAITVTTTMGAAANVRIVAQDYPTLLAAYTAAPAGATVLMKDIIFLEDFVVEPLNPAAIYTLKGGYPDFSINAAGYSTLNGTLTVRNGKLIVERLRIKP
jgi:hypothetical protein